MSPTEIQAHLRRAPFRPIRVHLTDGSSYEIRHPELALLTRRDLAIALDIGPDGLPDRNIFCDPLHVVRIEQIDGTTSN